MVLATMRNRRICRYGGCPGRINGLVEKSLALLPLLLVSLSMVAGTAWYRYYLRESAWQIAKAFEKQNIAEIDSGDVLALSTRLNAMSESVNWVCISVTRNGHQFMRQARGSCGNGVFQQFVFLNSSNHQGIRIEFSLRLPKSLEIAAIVFLFLQSTILLLLVWGTRQSERIRHQGERALSDLAAQVAHDIRSPVAALEAVLSKDRSIPGADRELLHAAATRIRGIADSLLREYRSRSSASSSKGGPPHAHVATARLLYPIIESSIREKCAVYSPGGANRITLSCDQSALNCFVRVDPVELGRTISNLLNNALEASSSDCQVRVVLAVKGVNVLVSIIDEGKGIPAELLPRLFKKGMSIGKDSGSGLGLYHAKVFSESAGGNIGISSTEGVGTAVTISLPMAPSPVWYARTDELPCLEKRLVLDDDPAVVTHWQRWIGLNRPVSACKTTEEFYRWHATASEEELRQTLFLVDYRLAGEKETGLDVISRLGLQAQAVLVTNDWDSDELQREVEKLGIKMLPKTLLNAASSVNQVRHE